MSIATAANAKALFGEMMTPQQKIAANTPTTAIAASFAGFLAETLPAKPVGGASSALAPSPEQLGKTLLSDAYDTSTGSVRADRIAAATERRSAEFAQLLRRTLSDNGIDPSLPVELSVGADGRVIVDNGHPFAAEIAKLFEDKPALAQTYRNLAAQNDHLAMLQAGAAYVRDWQAADSEGERQAAWQRSSALMERLSSLFSGRMTFGAGSAIVESQQILRRMGVA